MKTIAMATTLALTLFTGLNSAKADPHLQELGCAIEQDSAAAARNIYYNLRANPHFVPMYRSMYELHCSADRLHNLMLQGVPACRLQPEVDRLCELMHSTEDLVNLATGCHLPFRCQVQSRRYAFNLAELKATMARLDDNIHHLQEDLAPTPGGGVIPPPPGSGGLPLPGPPQPGLGGPSFNGQPGAVRFNNFNRTGSRSIPLIRKNGRVMVSLSLGR